MATEILDLSNDPFVKGITEKVKELEFHLKKCQVLFDELKGNYGIDLEA